MNVPSGSTCSCPPLKTTWFLANSGGLRGFGPFSAGDAGIRRVVLQCVQVYAITCPCDADLFARIVTVDPGTRIVLHLLHIVRLTDGSIFTTVFRPTTFIEVT